jgi:hypothetical protein
MPARATSAISPRAEVAPFDTAKRFFDWAVVGMLSWLVVPIAIAVVLAFEAPAYWSSMFSSPIGFVLLGTAIVSVGISGGLNVLARRVARPNRGRLLAGVGILLLAFGIQFVTLWIVFLSAALVVLLSPRQA